MIFMHDPEIKGRCLFLTMEWPVMKWPVAANYQATYQTYT